MQILTTLLNIFPTDLIAQLKSTPSLAISYILQCLFFTLSITTFLTLLLKLINFSYASIIFDNNLSRLAIFMVFLYTKFWEVQITYDNENRKGWNSLLGKCIVVFGYICALYIAMYVYDCGRNIGEWYVNKIRGYYIWQVIGYVLFAVILPLVIIYAHTKSNPKTSKYYSTTKFMILFMQLSIIILINAVKMKHIIFSSIQSLTIVSLVILRIVFNSYPFTRFLPLQAIPMIMMAFDAQYRQYKTVKNSIEQSVNLNKSNIRTSIEDANKKIPFELLKISVYFVLYMELCGNKMYLEFMMGVIAVVAAGFGYINGNN